MDNDKKSEISYKSAIIIYENYLVLTSNKVYPNGEDKLVFYDIKEKKIVKEIDGSFVGGINGLMVIELEYNKNIIICGCKKYINNQKNGIIIINLEFKDGNIIINPQKLEDTENFEVNCFCQINNEDNYNTKNIYFLVGGFEIDKREGMIKLYRLFKNEDNYILEYLQDIEIDNNDFEIFEGTINCIIQYKKNGKIIVSCCDGKIYCFSKPNIDYYLEDEIKDYSFLLDNLNNYFE